MESAPSALPEDLSKSSFGEVMLSIQFTACLGEMERDQRLKVGALLPQVSMMKHCRPSDWKPWKFILANL